MELESGEIANRKSRPTEHGLFRLMTTAPCVLSDSRGWTPPGVVDFIIATRSPQGWLPPGNRITTSVASLFPRSQPLLHTFCHHTRRNRHKSCLSTRTNDLKASCAHISISISGGHSGGKIGLPHFEKRAAELFTLRLTLPSVPRATKYFSVEFYARGCVSLG